MIGRYGSTPNMTSSLRGVFAYFLNEAFDTLYSISVFLRSVQKID